MAGLFLEEEPVNASRTDACASVLAATALFASLLAAAPALAQSKSAADIALLQGPGRQQTLLDGAKKEGGLTVYAAMPQGMLRALGDAFTKKYGLKVTTWRASSENVVQRMVAEARAGRLAADFVQNNEPGMAALRREHLMQAVNSPLQAELMPEAVPAHKEWAGLYVLVFVQQYNTARVRKDELPKAYPDLLDPKWKGRLGIESDDEAWFAYVLRELGQEKGTRLFEDVVRANGVSVRKGHTLLSNLVASGEVPLSLTSYSYAPVQQKREGAPVDWFVIPPAIAQFTSMGVVAKAPHPHAAVLFYDFLASAEGQKLLAEHDFVPTNTRLDSAFRNVPLKFIDPELFIDKNGDWTRTFNDVFKRK